MRMQHRHPLRPMFALCTLAAVTLASAQGVYRHVGPDGRVTYSDQPPAGASAPAPSVPTGSPAPAADLPFALRQVTARYPVTLYSGKECAPCDQGRRLLQERGVPFTEKTVATAQDLQAFQRIASDGSLPHLTIGSQPLTGFSAASWTQYLDAAGYPKQSALPRNYRSPAPTSLAPAVAAAPEPKAAAPASAAAPAPTPVAPPGPTPDNPAGIRF